MPSALLGVIEGPCRGWVDSMEGNPFVLKVKGVKWFFVDLTQISSTHKGRGMDREKVAR